MSIILRTNKGQALSYDEMDRNQSQFFYSSSLHNNNTKLRLHYTGSDNLDTATEDYGPNRYQEITFPSLSQTQTAAVAGNNTQVQFNDSGTFGADTLFTFNKVSNYLGIGTGTPSDRLDIHGDGVKGATVSLRGQSGGTGTLRHANINFLEGSTYLGRIGRAASTTEDLYFINNKAVGTGFGKVHIGAGTGDATTDNADNIVAATFTRTSTGISRVGIGTKIPNRQISLVGDEGIGISATGNDNLQSFLAPLPDGIISSTNIEGERDLIPNNSEPSGLLISSPIQTNGGSIVMAINTDTVQENEGFNIIKAHGGSYTNSEVIFSAQASGKVGINTNFPSDTGLTVAGNISGSGTLQVEAIATGTANNTSALVTTSTGLVQKIDAAPVPKGGIILWSGATVDIPTGWRLCDGGSINGMATPNLVNNFVVGAGNTYDVDDTGGSADAVVVSHNHTMQTSGTHTHEVIVSDNGWPDGAGDRDNNHYWMDETRNVDETGDHLTTPSGAHTHTINTTGESGTNKNLPPYYALAYIMYGGI
jgi:hypothetical protein